MTWMCWLLLALLPLSTMAGIIWGVAVGEDRYHRRLQAQISRLEARRAEREQRSADELARIVREGIQST